MPVQEKQELPQPSAAASSEGESTQEVESPTTDAPPTSETAGTPDAISNLDTKQEIESPTTDAPPTSETAGSADAISNLDTKQEIESPATDAQPTSETAEPPGGRTNLDAEQERGVEMVEGDMSTIDSALEATHNPTGAEDTYRPSSPDVSTPASTDAISPLSVETTKTASAQSKSGPKSPKNKINKGLRIPRAGAAKKSTSRTATDDAAGDEGSSLQTVSPLER
jgi:hypothetical protein